MLISVKSLSRYFYIHSKVNLISLSVSKVNIIVFSQADQSCIRVYLRDVNSTVIRVTDRLSGLGFAPIWNYGGFCATDNFFQKMIKINEKWPKKIFSWVYLTYFWSNILHNRENFKKISKISKISTFWKNLRFFYKNWWKKKHKKNMKKNEICGRKFQIWTQRMPLSSKMGFLST